MLSTSENKTTPTATETAAPQFDLGFDVVYDPDRLRADFEALLTELGDRAQTESVRGLVGNELLRGLRQDENRLRARLAGDFKLVVMGDFKRGKSSLVNALLETSVATTNVTPETVTINEIGYGSTLRAEICLSDGGRVGVQPDELAADRLQPILSNLSAKQQSVSHLEIQAPVAWLRGVRVVDTPGMGDVFKRFDNQVHDYLQEADAVLFLVSALSPLSESEETFLRLSLKPQQFPKLVFVVNLLDFARTDDEAERVLGHIQAKVNKVFPNAPVFGVSALDELCRLQNAPRPNPGRAAALELSFAKLRDHLRQSILLDRDLIQLDRAAEQFNSVLGAFEHNVALLKSALQGDQKRLESAIGELEDQNSALARRITSHKNKMRDEITALGEEGDRWMASFLDRFNTEAVGQIPSFAFADIQRHFHFFVTDMLRDAMGRCLSAHQPAIVESANTAKKAIIGDIEVASHVGIEATDVGLATSGGPAWSQLDTISVVLSQFLPIDDLLKFGVKLIMKKSEDAKQLANYQRRVESGMPELRQGVSQEIKAAYGQIARTLEGQIDAAYQKDREDTLAAMHRAREIRAEGEVKVSAAQATFTDVDALLADVRSGLDKFENKLWPAEVEPLAAAQPEPNAPTAAKTA